MAVATSLVIAGAVAAAAGATTQGIAARRAKNEAGDQNDIKNTMQSALDSLVEERPAFNNPYENMTNQFENLDNPYANLTVATEAFKMQAEQADQALANSLDVMMETGQAAGGATALAQAALQSKRGIAATIQAQETQNKSLAAEGEMTTQKLEAEGAQRLDEMKASGSILEQQDAINFHEAKMDRTAKLLDNAAQNEMDAKAARSAAIAGIGQSVVQGVGMIVPGFSSLGGKIPKGAAQIGKD
jgi:chromosome segregation ATPase